MEKQIKVNYLYLLIPETHAEIKSDLKVVIIVKKIIWTII